MHYLSAATPIASYPLNDNVLTITQDKYGNMLACGNDDIYVLREGKWISFEIEVEPCDLVSCTADNQIYLGGPMYLGRIEEDTLHDLTDDLSTAMPFKNLNNIVSVNSGTYVHADSNLFKVDTDLNNYHLSNVAFVGELNGNLIIQQEGEGFFLLVANNFRRINGSESLANKKLSNLLDLGNGTHLFLFDKEAFIYDGNIFYSWSTEGINWIGKLDIKYSGNYLGRLFFITASNELYEFTNKGDLASVRSLDFVASCFFIDNDGNLWIGAGQMIKEVRASSYMNAVSMNGEAGLALLESDNQNYFLGTSRGGYVSEGYSFLNGGLPLALLSMRTNSFYRDEDQILVSTANGLYKMVGKRAEEIYHSGMSYGVLSLEDGQTLIEATDTGLNWYERVFSRWTFQNHLYGIEKEVSHLIKDDSDRLWARAKDGAIYDLNFDVVLKTINPKVFKVGEIPKHEVLGLFEINGNPVVTTEQGIYELNEGLERFVKSESYANLLGNRSGVRHLFQDQLENIWFISEEESGYIKVVDRGVQKAAEKINLPDLQHEVFTEQPFIEELSDSRIVVSGKDGFLFINTDRIEDDLDFEVHLFLMEAFTKKDVKLSHSMLLSPREKPFYRLGTKVDRIRFSFSTSYSRRDSVVSYSFNINDEGWLPETKENSLLIDLPPGNNNVKVRAHYGLNEVSNTLVVPLFIAQNWYEGEMNQLLIAGLVLLSLLISIFILRSILKNRSNKIKALDREVALLREEVKVLRDKNEILSSQLISAINDSDLLGQLEKFQKDSERPEVRKSIKKLVKKLKEENVKTVKSVSPDPEFITRLKIKYPSLTKKDIRLCSLLRMDLTTKDIAPILDITVRGVEVSRYRLRKKLNLDNEVVLSEFLKEI